MTTYTYEPPPGCETCPSCKGRGEVSLGYSNYHGNYDEPPTEATERCGLCDGDGFLPVEPDDEDYDAESEDESDPDYVDCDDSDNAFPLASAGLGTDEDYDFGGESDIDFEAGY